MDADYRQIAEYFKVYYLQGDGQRNGPQAWIPARVPTAEAGPMA
jgi:hypothetical protein